MALILRPDQLQAIHHHVTQTYPEEGCGLILGHQSCDRTKTAREIWPAVNTWTSELATLTDPIPQPLPPASQPPPAKSPENRYWIDPQFLLRAQRYCSDHRLSIIGIYHSHPDHPATPSECDRTLAWPEYSYVIISVLQGCVHESRSWCLDAHRQFEHEVLHICDQS